jgi:hypothetical protein
VKYKKRSESASRMERTKDRRREPIVNFDMTEDVATAVSVEISRAIMLSPDLNLGTFLKSASSARTTIVMSDAVVLVSAAILAHIGNNRGAVKLLSKSATVTSYYRDMDLDNVKVREMFVTVLFALAPEFVALIEKSITVCISRSESEGKVIHTDARVNNALITLEQTKAIDESEMGSVISNNYKTWPSSANEARKHLLERRGTRIDFDLVEPIRKFERESSIQKTPTNMIAPSDSVSNIGSPPKTRYKLSEKDLMEHVKLRQSGVEMEFGKIFKDVQQPITVNRRGNRQGLGFTEDSNEIRDPWAQVNNILGKHRVKEYSASSGKVVDRAPRVEDFLDSEELSYSVLGIPPEQSSEITINYNPDYRVRYTPTETYLPSTIAAQSVEPESVIAPKDSADILRQKYKEMELNSSK